MRAFPVAVILLACGLLSAACKQTDKEAIEEAAAIQQARQTFQGFIDKFRSPEQPRPQFLVQGRFSDGQETERLVMTVVAIDTGGVHGMITDQPKYVSKPRTMENVALPFDDITDWMYFENGKMVGGFVYKVKRKYMKPEERAKLEKNLPYKIDE